MITPEDYELLPESSYTIDPDDPPDVWERVQESEKYISVGGLDIADIFTERAALVLALEMVRASGMDWVLMQDCNRRRFCLARERFRWETH